MNYFSSGAGGGPPADPANLGMPTKWQESIELLKSYGNTAEWLDRFITQDPSMLKLKGVISLLAYRPESVLITGPSGHGKELLSRALHWKPQQSFVPVNCAALPGTLLPSLLFGHAQGTFTGADADRPGVFEAAADGTVFLDEIGDMPLEQQAALLRILQEREVTRLGETKPRKISCRIIAATNRAVDTGEHMREDLYGRLMGLHLTISPLTKRPCDLPIIWRSLLPADSTLDMPHLYDELLNRYGVRYMQACLQQHLFGLV